MAGLTKAERKARELYRESAGDNPRNWNDLTEDEKAPWFSKATSDMESPPVTPVAPVAEKPAPKIPVPQIIQDPLAVYRQAQGSVKINCPTENRYVITGFRAASVFIKDVGTLAAPDQIDLPLNDDTAPAVQAALDDYNARKGVARD